MFILVYVNRNRMYIIGHKGSILYVKLCFAPLEFQVPETLPTGIFS